MTTGRGRGGGGLNWLPYAGLILTAGGIVYQGGVLSSQVQNNKDRIAKIEAVASAQQQALNEINLRGAASAAKLDFLVERARDVEEKERRK